MNMLKQILFLIRFNKPVGTLLLLWPAVNSLVLATGSIPDISLSVVFCLAVFLARSMGCIINDIADIDFDHKVTRTKNRPLTSGKISPLLAWSLFIAFGLSLFLLSFYFNVLTVGLSFIALFFMVIYPFSKRFFPIPQIFLGLAFGFSTVMAFSAVHGAIDMRSFAVYLFAIVWIVYYDTLYALVDLPDDEKIGIHSSAIFWGKRVFLALFLMQWICLALLVSLGLLFELSFMYYVSLILFALTQYYQSKLIATRQEKSYFLAFKQNNYSGMAWLVATLLGTI